MTRPDPATRATLATPPPTDLDFSSHSDLPSSLSDVQSIDGASDVLSEADFASDAETHAHPRRRLTVPAPLSEVPSDADADAETGSALADVDADAAGSGASDLE